MGSDDTSAHVTSSQELLRPDCVDPRDTWEVRVAGVLVDRRSQLTVPVIDENCDQPILVDEHFPEWYTERVHCPTCGNGVDIAVRGRWGQPCWFVCPECCGQWTLDDDEVSVRLLKASIIKAIEVHGIPDGARRAPEALEDWSDGPGRERKEPR